MALPQSWGRRCRKRSGVQTTRQHVKKQLVAFGKQARIIRKVGQHRSWRKDNTTSEKRSTPLASSCRDFGCGAED